MRSVKIDDNTMGDNNTRADSIKNPKTDRDNAMNHFINKA